MFEDQRAIAQSERPIGTVDGINFPAFLMGDPVLVGPNQHLVNRLNLIDTVPVQQMLYRESRQGFVLSDDTRLALLSDAEKERNEGLGVGAQSLIDIANMEGEVERVSTMYLSQDIKLKYTEPEYGDHSSVKPKAFLELIKEGSMPLMDFHTHPQDALPSPEDCLMLITGIIEGQPLYRARMVLCPNVQILAVADNNTLWFRQEQALEVLKQYQGTNIYGNNYEELLRRQKNVVAIQERFLNAAARVLGFGLKNMADNADFYRGGKLTLEEVKRINEEDQKHRKEQNGRVMSLVDHMITPVVDSYSGFEQFARNKGHIQMLQDFNIKLYISEDKSNFYAFTG